MSSLLSSPSAGLPPHLAQFLGSNLTRPAPGEPGEDGDEGGDEGRDEHCPLARVLGGTKQARTRLHAIHPTCPGQEAAATGFGLALIAALARHPGQPMLWVQDGQAAAESGRPYGLGLAALGIAPAHLIVVAVSGADNVLAAAEMGLEEEGLAGVLAELPTRLPADMLKRGKRLSLRCESRRTPCLLVHATAAPVEAPVATRWMAASRPFPATSSVRDAAPDFTTTFDLALVKNRFGSLGRWSVAWRAMPSPLAVDRLLSPAAAPRRDHHAAQFQAPDVFQDLYPDRFQFVACDEPATDPRAVAADPADRSAGAAVRPLRAAWAAWAA